MVIQPQRTSESPRVYFAARFDRVDEVRMAARDLERAGLSVVSSWIDNEPLTSDELVPSGRAAQAATEDIRDLRSATTFVAFTESGATPQGRGGRHTEFGVALALGLRILVVGPREHVFHCLPRVERYDDWDSALQALVYEASAATG